MGQSVNINVKSGKAPSSKKVQYDFTTDEIKNYLQHKVDLVVDELKKRGKGMKDVNKTE